ncbi:MAG: ABC transporter ATP-binding protein [Candidatus Eisenbacteria bacterium]|nr:ABC transporter ATP-binding protein [Candidatus Eisenbacteria bacterium]
MTTGAAPLLRLSGLTRRFGPVMACDQVDLTVEAGTIHGLIGENGAGKSTLMRLVYGLERPDAGSMEVDGQPVTIRSPREALALGIGMVHQHFQLVPTLSVLDNVLLGAEPVKGPWLDRGAGRRRLLESAGAMLDGVDVMARVDHLSIGRQQRVEIARLLFRDARLLILDEPTAVLSPREAASLFTELARLRAAGRTIILITHRLADVLHQTDAVSIMRQGRLIATRMTRDTGYDELAAMLVASSGGTDPALPDDGSAVVNRKSKADAGPPILELRHVTFPGSAHTTGLADVSIAIAPFEIVAVVGVDGSGQSELIRLAAGRATPSAGTVHRPGTVGWIPEDRLHEAVIPMMSAAENLLLGRHRDSRFSRRGVIDRTQVAAHATRLMKDGDVRPAKPERAVATLSGGNQQKLVLARETSGEPPLLVAAHPTRGLDLAATRRVYDVLKAARARGAAVLLVSAELDEARAIADRIVVMYAGRVVGELLPGEATNEVLGRLMTGGAPAGSMA